MAWGQPAVLLILLLVLLSLGISVLLSIVCPAGEFWMALCHHSIAALFLGMFLLLCTFVCTPLHSRITPAFLRIPSVGMAASLAVTTVGSIPLPNGGMGILAALLPPTCLIGVNVHPSLSFMMMMVDMLMIMTCGIQVPVVIKFTVCAISFLVTAILLALMSLIFAASQAL